MPSFGSLPFRRETDKMERVHWRATKIAMLLDTLTYKETLECLHLFKPIEEKAQRKQQSDNTSKFRYREDGGSLFTRTYRTTGNEHRWSQRKF